MARLVTLLAPLGALALGALLVVGIAGVLVRQPWEPPCAVTAMAGELVTQGSVAEMRQQVGAALSVDEQGDDGEGDGDGAGADAAVVDSAPARTLRAALSAGPALSCAIDPIAATDEPKDRSVGLTPRARALRAEVRETFGRIRDGGYGPEEVLPGRDAGGEHSLGRAIDFFFRPMDDPEQVQRGWLLANWAVANAERLGIRTVIYSDHIWTARRSDQGWRDYRFRGANPGSPVNRHLDHVHLDVA